jgi:hypothetical protein
MRRQQLTWAAIFGVFFLAFVLTVAALNASVYSASGFVSSYVEAIARHDPEAALDMAGVEAPGGRADAAAGAATDAATDLLTAGALSTLTGIRVVSDVTERDGVHLVSVEWRSGESSGTSAYRVTRDGALFGVFTAWRFVDSPIATIDVTVLHDRQFDVNGETVTTDDPNHSSAFAVFTPGVYVFAQRTDFLEAAPQRAVVADATTDARVTLDVQASAAFVSAVQKQVNAYLDGCVTQQVLLPTACPFGYPVRDRITSVPQWSMTTYPVVTIQPGVDVGSWVMPASEGAAHITVDVRSLFDGTVSTANEDVPFGLGYELTLTPDGGLTAKAVL